MSLTRLDLVIARRGGDRLCLSRASAIRHPVTLPRLLTCLPLSSHLPSPLLPSLFLLFSRVVVLAPTCLLCPSPLAHVPRVSASCYPPNLSYSPLFSPTLSFFRFTHSCSFPLLSKFSSTGFAFSRSSLVGLPHFLLVSLCLLLSFCLPLFQVVFCSLFSLAAVLSAAAAIFLVGALVSLREVVLHFLLRELFLFFIFSLEGVSGFVGVEGLLKPLTPASGGRSLIEGQFSTSLVRLCSLRGERHNCRVT